jgi:hypothetical protein
MAIGDSYATTAELKSYLRITDTTDDTLLTAALATASRLVEHHCSRQFNKDSPATPTARVYYPLNQSDAAVDDFYTTTGLIVAMSTADDGTYGTTLTAAQYQLLPLNGVRSGEAGWPYFRLRLQNTTFTSTVRPQLQVTASWGWNAVPAAVKQATVYMAEEVYKLKGAPFGVANTDQFGPIRVRENPRVMAMLAPYRLNPVQMA